MIDRFPVSASQAHVSSEFFPLNNAVGVTPITHLKASWRLLRGTSRAFVLTSAIALMGVLAGAALAQAPTLVTGWYQQTPANTAGHRLIHAMAYDAGHAQVVLFGGFNSGGYANDTWLWNGANWTQANPSTPPTPRAAPAMVYDPVHNNVVMFGGFSDPSTRLGDTWIWDGTNWTNVSPPAPAASPSPRSNSVMFFDPATNNVVLFGGTNGSDLGDTWVWDGTHWTNVTPAAATPGTAATSPSREWVRAEFTMRRRTSLFCSAARQTGRI